MSNKPRSQRRDGPVEVWIDASWNQETKCAGCAAVITRDDKLVEVLTHKIDFRLTSNSSHAELWGAAYALEYMPPESVRRLYTDSTYVRSRIAEIRHNIVPEYYVPDELRQRLKAALEKHPDIDIEWKKRHKGKIPIADNFAKAAAIGNQQKIASWSKAYR